MIYGQKYGDARRQTSEAKKLNKTHIRCY